MRVADKCSERNSWIWIISRGAAPLPVIGYVLPATRRCEACIHAPFVGEITTTVGGILGIALSGSVAGVRLLTIVARKADVFGYRNVSGQRSVIVLDGIADKSTLVGCANARLYSIALDNHLIRAVDPERRRGACLGARRYGDIVASKF